MNKLKTCLWALFLGVMLLTTPAEAIPQIRAAVTDETGVLSPEVTANLDLRLRDHYARTHNQIALLVVHNLEGLPIEDYAHQVFNAWGGGQAGANNGILVVFALDAHRDRIEVGPGLQDRVTDGTAVHILHDQRPLLRTGQFGPAFSNVLNELIRRTDSAVAIPVSPENFGASGGSSDYTLEVGGCAIIFLLLVGVVVYWMSRSHRRGEEEEDHYIPPPQPRTPSIVAPKPPVVVLPEVPTSKIPTVQPAPVIPPVVPSPAPPESPVMASPLRSPLRAMPVPVVSMEPVPTKTREQLDAELAEIHRLAEERHAVRAAPRPPRPSQSALQEAQDRNAERRRREREKQDAEDLRRRRRTESSMRLTRTLSLVGRNFMEFSVR